MSSAAEARAVFRALSRTASRTFKGDATVRRAFMLKARTEYMPSATDSPNDFATKLAFAREVETVLRTNIVQATRTDTTTYKLHVTSDTELGENETLKSSPKPAKDRPRMSCKDAAEMYAKQGWGGSVFEMRLQLRQLTIRCADAADLYTPISPTIKRSFSTSARCAKSKSNSKPKTSAKTPKSAPRASDSELSQNATDDLKNASLNFSQLKKVSKDRVVPELRKEDLREAFVCGSGPGGQSINKTRNNVQLLHLPTGLRVDCQLTRSLPDNRRIARLWLQRKLDEYFNPGLSRDSVRAARQNERKRQKAKKKRKAEREKAAVDGLSTDGTASLAGTVLAHMASPSDDPAAAVDDEDDEDADSSIEYDDEYSLEELVELANEGLSESDLESDFEDEDDLFPLLKSHEGE